MAFIEHCAFEVLNSNAARNEMQNVPGKFGTGTGGGFTAADCNAGWLCVRNGHLPCEGYEDFDKVNGNSWYFNAAADGEAGGFTGDHTGIYAFNNYDVAKATVGANVYNIGVETLGIGLPAGERGDFCEIIVGEQYGFGTGNFSTAPADDTYKYATIGNGQLVAATAAPAAGTGVYFTIEYSRDFNQGTAYAGKEYVLMAHRN